MEKAKKDSPYFFKSFAVDTTENKGTYIEKKFYACVSKKIKKRRVCI